jgi:ABC-2 type transport system permease protein
MEGFRAVTLDPGGIADVAGPVAALAAFSTVFLAVAVRRFRVEETKVSWA